MITDQLICRLEVLHNKGIIHRDIKPDNIAMGLGCDSRKVMLIDLGLAQFYRRSRTRTSFTGTPSHTGIQQTRKDDLESLSYNIWYFWSGSLPWQNTKAPTMRQKLGKIQDCKEAISLPTLRKILPEVFHDLVMYPRELKPEARPDYMFLRRRLRMFFATFQYEWDFNFDWIQQKNKTS